MTDPRPWECPRCKRVLAPHVDVCPCSEDGTSGVAAKIAPVTPPSASGVRIWPTGAQSITTGTTWTATNTTVTQAPVRVIYANRAA